jgi:hypothetical protein
MRSQKLGESWILSACLRLGDGLCQRNVVLAILFSWLILFYVFSDR